VKMCLWIGPSDCYRNQDAVLQTPADTTLAKEPRDLTLRKGPSGHSYRNGKINSAAHERGGSVPSNLLQFATGVPPWGAEHHPRSTPYQLMDWWARYLLPPKGTLLDPFVGSGTSLLAGLNNGAKSVIGVDVQKDYLAIARRRIQKA